jgi:tetratricopeptide (TPR) repeat protein
LVRLARYDDARLVLSDAEVAAQEAQDDRLTARIQLALASAAENQEHFADELQWVKRAEGPIRRAGGDEILEARRLEALGNAQYHAGRLAEAESDFRSALPVFERHHHPRYFAALINLGATLRGAKRYDESVTVLRRALDYTEKEVGPDHPLTASALENLATTLVEQGGFSNPAANQAVLPLFQREVAMFERIHGSEHPQLANALYNLGGTFYNLGRYREAAAAHERAYNMSRKYSDAHSDAVVDKQAALGETWVKLGRYADAIALLDPIIGLESPDAAEKDFALAQALWESGDRKRALLLARQARDLLRKDPSMAREADEVEAWLKKSK